MNYSLLLMQPMKLVFSKTITATGATVVLTHADACPLEGIDKAAFSGELLSCFYCHGAEPKLYVGLGAESKVQPNHLRQAAGVAARKLLELGIEIFSLSYPRLAEYVQPVVEGAVLGAYKFETFVPKDKRRKHALQALTLVCPEAETKAFKQAANRGLELAEAANLTRAIGNLPANVLTPESLAAEAVKLSKAEGLKCKVWNEKALQKEGFGGIIAVGQGSANPPRLIRMDYAGGGKNAPTLAVVGKAITFDTGGISLKPGDQMEEMKFDKLGGCAVLGVMRAVARLKLKVNVVGLIASAENMPSSKAYRPGDILTAWDGQTIEVHNTDAEGRIVLADTLAYAHAVVKPTFMIDMATLTGACLVALGMDRAGLFCDCEDAVNALKQIGETTGDRVWHLPMGEEFTELMKSPIASMKNIGGGRYGGASSAASFLQNWTGNTPWAHLDIAGTAWTTKTKPYLEMGATGFGVRLVTEFAESYVLK